MRIFRWESWDFFQYPLGKVYSHIPVPRNLNSGTLFFTDHFVPLSGIFLFTDIPWTRDRDTFSLKYKFCHGQVSLQVTRA